MVRMTTEPVTTSMTASNEADQEQLATARAQGDAYGQALEALDGESGVITKRAGQYLIGFIQEQAEGLYGLAGEQLVWHEPPPEANANLQIVVADSGDGRFVPGLDVSLTVLSNEGDELIRTTLPFLWHPFLHHYGINARVPGAGPYIVRVVIEPPTFMRHDPINGRRYADRVTVEFTRQQFSLGRKRSPAAQPRDGVTPIAGADNDQS